MGYLVPLNFSLELPHVNRRNVHGQWLKQKFRMQRDLNSNCHPPLGEANGDVFQVSGYHRFVLFSILNIEDFHLSLPTAWNQRDWFLPK